MRCAAITRAGERCKLVATHGSYCHSHAPETADERRQRARRGGKAGGNGRGASGGEIAEIKDLLSGLTRQVLAGEQQTGRAAVAAQIVNALLRAIELERKIREQEEIIERLEALERTAKDQKGGRRWGA